MICSFWWSTGSKTSCSSLETTYRKYRIFQKGYAYKKLSGYHVINILVKNSLRPLLYQKILFSKKTLRQSKNSKKLIAWVLLWGSSGLNHSERMQFWYQSLQIFHEQKIGHHHNLLLTTTTCVQCCLIFLKNKMSTWTRTFLLQTQ